MAQRIFISHSHQDRLLADALVDLLRSSVHLGREQVFYSSGIDTGIPAGRNFIEHIRRELRHAALVVQLITPSFLVSPFCLCEFGGAWLADIDTFPLLAPPVTHEDLRGVFGNIQAEILSEDGAAVDRLADRVMALYGFQPDVAAWNRERGRFLARLPGLLQVSEQQAPSVPHPPISNRAALGFDPRSLGFIAINRWSPARPLVPGNMQTHLTGIRPRQSWLEGNALERIAQQFDPVWYGGEVCQLVDFGVDHWATPKGRTFDCTFALAPYREHLSTIEALKVDPAARARIAAAMDEGRLHDFARSSPPSSTKINVAVISPEDRLLAIKRSAAVERKRNHWTLGPNEMMKPPPPGDPEAKPEDFFELAHRCLREELDLEQHEHGPVNVSWVGYYLPTLEVKVFAQVRAHVSAAELEERIHRSHGAFEADQTDWVPFTREHLLRLVDSWASDEKGRRWSDSAPLAAQELWRMSPLLKAVAA